MPFPEPLIRLLAEAKHVLALTGAGVSAESGVPTFRDAQTGLWAKFKPEDLASPEAFRRNPKRVWDWYAWRREQLASIAPNAAHLALARLEQLLPRFTVITQNVDGLHQRAGSRDVVELHGNINRTRCLEANHEATTWKEDEGLPPRCPTCGSPLRPDVVWFGEYLPEAALSRALTESVSCDVLLSVGTSGRVYPAAMLPYTALENGGTVVEVNSEPSPLTEHAQYAFTGQAGALLPELTAALQAALGTKPS